MKQRSLNTIFCLWNDWLTDWEKERLHQTPPLVSACTHTYTHPYLAVSHSKAVSCFSFTPLRHPVSRVFFLFFVTIWCTRRHWFSLWHLQLGWISDMLSASDVPSVLYAQRCKFFHSGFQGRHHLRWNTRGAEGDCLRGHIKPSYVRPPWPFVCFTWKCCCFGFHCWRFPRKSSELQTSNTNYWHSADMENHFYMSRCMWAFSFSHFSRPPTSPSRSVTQLSLPLHHSVSLRHHKYSLIQCWFHAPSPSVPM